MSKFATEKAQIAAQSWILKPLSNPLADAFIRGFFPEALNFYVVSKLFKPNGSSLPYWSGLVGGVAAFVDIGSLYAYSGSVEGPTRPNEYTKAVLHTANNAFPMALVGKQIYDGDATANDKGIAAAFALLTLSLLYNSYAFARFA